MVEEEKRSRQKLTKSNRRHTKKVMCWILSDSVLATVGNSSHTQTQSHTRSAMHRNGTTYCRQSFCSLYLFLSRRSCCCCLVCARVILLAGFSRIRLFCCYYYGCSCFCFTILKIIAGRTLNIKHTLLYTIHMFHTKKKEFHRHYYFWTFFFFHFDFFNLNKNTKTLWLFSVCVRA